MKNVIAILALCAMYMDTHAQTRKMRPDEIAYFNSINDAVYTSAPHVYKDWVVVGDEKRADARKIWCDGPMYGVDCTGDCPSSMGVGDPLSLSYVAEYSMPDNDKNSIMGASVGMVKDFTNSAQLAASQKYAAKIKMKLSMYYNLSNVPMSLSYCAATPMENLQLPVPAAVAVLGKRSVACPIQDGGRTSMGADYYDRALIILGKPVTKKTAAKSDDGLTTTTFIPAFDRSKIAKPITQNIIVEIKGDIDDIKELVELIDWNKLNSMLSR